MQFKIKKSLIISTFITILFFQNNLYSNSKTAEIEDFGIISLMYHRFEENKYPSTNIKINDFKEHLKIIENSKIQFINPKNFENELKNKKTQRKILLTIDDGFSSFYNNAWPILKDVEYDLGKVRSQKLVKPIYFTQFPRDLDALQSTKLKKETFIKIVLK